MGVQIVLPDVPLFTAVQELHFNPKCTSHPSTQSPRSIIDMASLGRFNQTGHTYYYMCKARQNPFYRFGDIKNEFWKKKQLYLGTPCPQVIEGP